MAAGPAGRRLSPCAAPDDPPGRGRRRLRPPARTSSATRARASGPTSPSTSRSSSAPAWAVTAAHRRRRYALVQVHTLPDFLVLGDAAAAAGRRPGPARPPRGDAGVLPEPLPARGEPARLRGCSGCQERGLDRPGERRRDRQRRRCASGSSGSGVRPEQGHASSPTARRSPASTRPATQPRPFAADGTVRLVYAGALTPTYELDVRPRGAGADRARDRPELASASTSTAAATPPSGSSTRRPDLGIDERVTFHGRIPIEDVPAAVARADIGVAPTRRDPFTDVSLSTKVFEYAAMGKPVVASRLPMVERTFPPGSVATYDPGDPASMARGDPVDRRRSRLAREARSSGPPRSSQHRPGSTEAARYIDLVDRLAARLPGDVRAARRPVTGRSDGPIRPVRYDTGPVRSPSIHLHCRTASPHDLPSQTRRQSAPSPLARQPEPAEHLPEHRLRPGRRPSPSSSSSASRPSATTASTSRRGDGRRPDDHPGRLRGARRRSRSGGSSRRSRRVNAERRGRAADERRGRASRSSRSSQQGGDASSSRRSSLERLIDAQIQAGLATEAGHHGHARSRSTPRSSRSRPRRSSATPGSSRSRPRSTRARTSRPHAQKAAAKEIADQALADITTGGKTWEDVAKAVSTDSLEGRPAAISAGSTRTRPRIRRCSTPSSPPSRTSRPPSSRARTGRTSSAG